MVRSSKIFAAVLAALFAFSATQAFAQVVPFGTISGGGGSGVITSGTSTTSGCLAGGGVLRSVSNLVQCGAGLAFDAGILSIGTASATRGGVDLFGATHAFRSRIQASESLGANWTLTLPTTDGNSGEVLRTDGSGVTSWLPLIETKGGAFLDPTGAANVVVWRAPFACTVTKVQGNQVGGTSSEVNARKNGTDALLAANLSVTAGSWASTSTIQNASFAVDDSLEIRLISLVGTPTSITIQVECTR